MTTRHFNEGPTFLNVVSIPAEPATGFLVPTGPLREAARHRDWLSQTGFYARDSRPSALLHLSRRELSSASSLSGLLRELEGVRIHSPHPGRFGLQQVDARGEEWCEVHVYINGSKTTPHPVGNLNRLDEVFS